MLAHTAATEAFLGPFVELVDTVDDREIVVEVDSVGVAVKKARLHPSLDAVQSIRWVFEVQSHSASVE